MLPSPVRLFLNFSNSCFFFFFDIRCVRFLEAALFCCFIFVFSWITFSFNGCFCFPDSICPSISNVSSPVNMFSFKAISFTSFAESASFDVVSFTSSTESASFDDSAFSFSSCFSSVSECCSLQSEVCASFSSFFLLY